MLITFVCSGNTCRSPMAEYILKDKLKKAKIKGVKVESAGLYAENDTPMSENSKKALSIMGIKADKFKSKVITFDLLEKSDVIVCMTNSHKIALMEFTNKAKTISEIINGQDIADPYGYDIDAYLKTFSDLDYACDIIIKKLKEKKEI